MLTRRSFSVLFILNVCVAICLARKRIYGGWKAKIADYPWHVSLLDNNKQYCAGSILSHYHVLTAAHCLYGKTNLGSLSIKYGTNRLDDGTGFTLSVVKLARHPYFKGPMDHDIGIVTVGAPYIKFSSNAQPSMLRNFPAKTGELLVVSGHGRTKAGGSSSPILYATMLLTMDWNTCAKIPSMRGVLTKGMVCASRYDRSACPGDSGGAVFAKASTLNTQVAVVSGGPPINGQKACHPGHPNIFTNIANYENWINEETQYTALWSLI